MRLAHSAIYRAFIGKCIKLQEIILNTTTKKLLLTPIEFSIIKEVILIFVYFRLNVGMNVLFVITCSDSLHC